jgi:hypothetical protein
MHGNTKLKNMMSGYGLDDRAIEVQSPAGAKDISSNPCVQTGVTLTSHLHLVPSS